MFIVEHLIGFVSKKTNVVIEDGAFECRITLKIGILETGPKVKLSIRKTYVLFERGVAEADTSVGAKYHVIKICLATENCVGEDRPRLEICGVEVGIPLELEKDCVLSELSRIKVYLPSESCLAEVRLPIENSLGKVGVVLEGVRTRVIGGKPNSAQIIIVVMDFFVECPGESSARILTFVWKMKQTVVVTFKLVRKVFPCA
jgi:hypothetical protein